MMVIETLGLNLGTAKWYGRTSENHYDQKLEVNVSAPAIKNQKLTVNISAPPACLDLSGFGQTLTKREDC